MRKQFVNDAYQKELHYWKKAALESVLTKSGRKKSTDLAKPRVFSSKAAIENVKKVYEIDFYLKSQYLTHNEKQRTFIQDISSHMGRPSFEAITDYLKTFAEVFSCYKIMGEKTFVSSI